MFYIFMPSNRLADAFFWNQFQQPLNLEKKRCTRDRRRTVELVHALSDVLTRPQSCLSGPCLIVSLCHSDVDGFSAGECCFFAYL